MTHGLDANSKALDCQKCHDRADFCNSCHLRELRMPLEHSSLGWIAQHSQAAKNDVENCASCHMTDDLTCARAGCHSDFDGIRGTDPKIHISGAEQFDTEGDWHNDNSFYCYQCHTRSNRIQTGFCSYCHYIFHHIHQAGK